MRLWRGDGDEAEEEDGMRRHVGGREGGNEVHLSLSCLGLSWRLSGVAAVVEAGMLLVYQWP